MKTTKITISKETFSAFLKAIKELNDSDIILIKLLDEQDTKHGYKRIEISYNTESTLFYLGFLTQLYNAPLFCEQ